MSISNTRIKRNRLQSKGIFTYMMTNDLDKILFEDFNINSNATNRSQSNFVSMMRHSSTASNM